MIDMKKRSIQLIALILISAVILCLTACSSSGKKLVGKWRSPYEVKTLLDPIVDYSVEHTEKGIKKTLYERIGNAYENVGIDLVLTFSEDGFFEFSFDQDSVSAAIDTIRTNVGSEITAVYTEFYGQYGLTPSGSFDDFTDQVMAAFDLENKFKDSLTGSYAVKGDKLFFNAYTDGSDYVLFTVEDDTLTIVEATGNIADRGTAYHDLVRAYTRAGS